MDDQAPTLDVENDLFNFETGHLALRGNEDYCEVLKTLVILSAQREKALKDFKAVAELKIECLKDPFGTLKKMQTDKTLGIPPRQELAKLPKIDFQKYKVKVAESDLLEIYSDGPQKSVNQSIIDKPAGNNNKSWTPEEQKRLEELLQIYPPEPIEMKRFQKIAKALGNRTVHQVASRLQKYFLKLYKAGLPIPGRIPKCAEKHRKSSLHKHQRFNHYLWKPTTFFPELSVPVQMDDLNNIPGPSEIPTNMNISSGTDNYLFRSEYLQNTETPENAQELQLKLLKRVRDVKLHEEIDDYVPFNHIGYKCDYCDESPIVGTRWFCTVCSDSVDFCTDCVISQLYTETPHPLQHWLASTEDDSGGESSLILGFSNPAPEYDKQISEELRSKELELDDDNDKNTFPQADLAADNIPLLEIERENEHPTVLRTTVDQSPVERLRTAVIERNITAVKEILEETTSEDSLNYQFETENGNRKILSIACEHSSKEIVQLLYQKVIEYNLEPMDESWYYWGPLHFAASFTDCEKLGAIIDVIQDQKKLNSLSIFSENALHVLLEYGRRTESFYVQLTNGWESRICHVIPEEHDEVVQCARLLIEAGIDVNHNNIWNETPLIIAIRFRLLRVIQLLLMKKDIDLDSCKDMRKGKSARDLLRENEIHLNLLSPHTVTMSPAQKLFTFLKSNDEELFLRYNNENIRNFVNEVDGYEGFTMLQLCLIKGYIEYEKQHADLKESCESDVLKTQMLKFFCEKGYGRSVEHLLNEGADVMKKAKLFGNRNVFQMAVKLSYYPFLTMLLQHRLSQVSEKDILEVLANTSEKYLQSKTCNVRHVLFLLGCKLEILQKSKREYLTLLPGRRINKFDTEAQSDHVEDRMQKNAYSNRKILNKILDLYLLNNSYNDEFKDYICQILRLGASLTGTICEQSVPHEVEEKLVPNIWMRFNERLRAFLDFGSSKTQDPNRKLNKISHETLRTHLDQCIDSKGNVCYDSLILDEQNGDKVAYSETEVLHYLVHNPKQSDLLNHPVLLYLIHSKWLKTRHFFHVNLLLYTVFLVFLYLHTIMLQMNMSSIGVSVLFTILLLVQVTKECLQLLLYFPRYFFDPSNYLEITVIVCSAINLLHRSDIAMILAVLFSTIIFLLMLGQLPKFTKYMIIFSSTKYFLEYAAFYFIQFVSFAICFLILLPSEGDSSESTWINAMGQVLIKLFDTLIYFIGQYDGDINAPPKFPIFGRIIVAMFVFCMSIILNNLLVGLIVTDMDMIQKTSKQQRQVKMIKFIVRIETFLKSFKGKSGKLNWFCKTQVFEEGCRKVRNIKSSDLTNIFDEDDTTYLEKIQENQSDYSNVLNHLYEYIISGIYSDHRSAKESRDILFKLSRLEEKLRSRR